MLVGKTKALGFSEDLRCEGLVLFERLGQVIFKVDQLLKVHEEPDVDAGYV